MKLSIIFCLVIIICISIEAQIVEESNSGYVSIINTNKLQNILEQFVNEEITRWQTRDKFETLEDYLERVNESNRNKKVKLLTEEKINNMANELISLEITGYLYDPDNETYRINFFDLAPIYIKVPISNGEAVSFDRNINSLAFKNPKYILTDRDFVLTHLEIFNESNNKTYIYDYNSEINFQQEKIALNFKPIEINITSDLNYETPSQEDKIISIGKSDVDINPPTIEIFNSELQQDKVNNVEADSIIIKGYANDSSGINKVLVNGQEAEINEDGIFNYTYLLSEGRNLLILTARDNYDNSSTLRYYLYRTSEKEKADLINQFGENHALIIGIEEYLDSGITDLDNPVNDARQFKNALTSLYTFENENITLLMNPNKSDIVKELMDLRLKLSSNDNLIIFYAGHGLWDEGMQVGYWLPKDAYLDNPVNWFSNTELRNYIRAIKTDHTLLISDACFSGSIFKIRDVSNIPPPSINELYKLPSRKAMTSGTMSVVPDRSVFIEYLISRLKENQQQFLTSEELFSGIRMAVINNSPNYQVPQYGAIHDSGDQGGDFIFIRK